jgi:fused signal recognition particle receptor
MSSLFFDLLSYDLSFLSDTVIVVTAVTLSFLLTWLISATDDGKSESSSKKEVAALSPQVKEETSLNLGFRDSKDGLWGKLRSLFVTENITRAQLDELEAILIQSDLGVSTASRLIALLREEVSSALTLEDLCKRLREELVKELAFNDDKDPLLTWPKKGANASPYVLMLVGVNGAGKTTTAAKIASKWQEKGCKVLLVAGDTFRAAAVAQLKNWGERLNVPVHYAQYEEGSKAVKPATVIFSGMERGIREKFDAVIIDTAGRLQNKSNLMLELQGVRNSIERNLSGAPHETLLVLDGTTGQNGLEQARQFKEVAKISGVVITKLDGTAKGGVVIAIRHELKVPVKAIGIGESVGALQDFDPESFAKALVG